VAELLPRFYRRQLERDDERRLARLLLEAGDVDDDEQVRLVRRSADGHEAARRRGLPVIGRGVRGSTIHTDPVRALLSKERRGELRL
jgi:hypothetical protein